MLVLMHGGLAPLIPNLSLRGEGDKRTVRSQEGKKVDAVASEKRRLSRDRAL
jgi:hypothetical protein